MFLFFIIVLKFPLSLKVQSHIGIKYAFCGQRRTLLFALHWVRVSSFVSLFLLSDAVPRPAWWPRWAPSQSSDRAPSKYGSGDHQIDTLNTQAAVHGYNAIICTFWVARQYSFISSTPAWKRYCLFPAYMSSEFPNLPILCPVLLCVFPVLCFILFYVSICLVLGD